MQVGESHIVFGGVYFDQYASNFNEYPRKTVANGQNIGMSLRVLWGVHINQFAPDFDEFSLKLWLIERL